MDPAAYPRFGYPPLPPPSPHAFEAPIRDQCPCTGANLSYAFALFGADYGTWVGGFALAFLIPAIVGGAVSFAIFFAMAGSLTSARGLGISYNLAIVGAETIVAAFAMLFQAGYLRLILLRIRGYHATVGEILNFNGQTGPLLAWGLIVGLVTNGMYLIPSLILGQPRDLMQINFGGLIASYIVIAVVGTFLYTLTCLVTAILIDQRLGLGDAISLSAKVMAPRLIAGCGLVFVAGIFSVLGAFACGIGMILTGPLLYLLIGSFYYDCFIRPNLSPPTTREALI